MNVSRRQFFSILGAGTAAAALPGCICPPKCARARAKIGLQLYSLKDYIGGIKDKKTGKVVLEGVGLERGLSNIAAIGYKGVEFFGGSCFGNDPKDVRKWLKDAGLAACGIHVSNSQYGFDTKAWTFNKDEMKKICDFNLTFGNNLIVCPGGGNIPPGAKWSDGQGGDLCKPSQAIDDFTKRLCDLYNEGAEVAANFGCRIGIHNHTWEHGILMMDGETTFWDYFFSHTDQKVVMEQDVGWSTCAGVDPKEQYVKYPHRSPTLHAKENGMAKTVKKFDAILGKPGEPGAVPVDWDGLIPVSEKDGVEWYVVECERHFDSLYAVLPSYNFLKAKGLN